MNKLFEENLNFSDLSKTFPAVAKPFSLNALSIMRAIANQDRKSNLCLIDQNEINTNLNLGKKVFCKFYLVSNQTNKIPLFFEVRKSRI